MTLSVLTARIDSNVKKLITKWCKANGIVMAHFVEEAIIDKLEEEGDLKDLEQLRREPTKLFSDVLKQLKI